MRGMCSDLSFLVRVFFEKCGGIGNVYSPAFLRIIYFDYLFNFTKRSYHACIICIYHGGFMKKRVILIPILILLIVSCAFLLWPYLFSDIAPDCTSITVKYIDLEQDTETTVFEEGTGNFIKIQNILENYTYHRSFRTFSGESSLNGNHAGYWLFIYLDTDDDRKVIICGGTGQINIDGRVYRVGYWGDGPSLSFMGEIVNILEATQ